MIGSTIKERMMKNEQIFNPPPEQWGLRGDPYLWNELKDNYSDLPLSSEKFKESIIEYIEQIIEQKLTLETCVQIERFKHGGMSSGYVCGEFWLNQAIPLLIERYNAYRK
jgi:hypothetical protein